MKTHIKPPPPQCPYCGDIFQDHESRWRWNRRHLDRRRHRIWWRLKFLRWRKRK